jgi:hypothetical protein
MIFRLTALLLSLEGAQVHHETINLPSSSEMRFGIVGFGPKEFVTPHWHMTHTAHTAAGLSIDHLENSLHWELPPVSHRDPGEIRNRRADELRDWTIAARIGSMTTGAVDPEERGTGYRARCVQALAIRAGREQQAQH